MKQIVYTCLRCAKQQIVSADDPDVPFGWALIRYDRYHAKQEDSRPGAAEVPIVGGTALRTYTQIHACGDCAPEILDFLDPKPPAAPSLKSA